MQQTNLDPHYSQFCTRVHVRTWTWTWTETKFTISTCTDTTNFTALGGLDYCKFNIVQLTQ